MLLLPTRTDLSFDDIRAMRPAASRDESVSFFAIIDGEEYQVFVGRSLMTFSHRYDNDEVDHSWDANLECWVADEVAVAV